MKNLHPNWLGIALILWATWSCKLNETLVRAENKNLPESFGSLSSNSESDTLPAWTNLFQDQYLKTLIDSALSKNQELNIFLQEIEVANTEVRARKGEYLPFVSLQAGAGMDKVGRYTRYGALEHSNEIKPGEEFPEPFSDYILSANASWELDVWKKLRNAKKSALLNYLATVEGKNFLVTQLVAEVTQSYYELVALDNQLEILKQNIQIQKNALEIVKLQKNAAKVTELAVKRFEAEVAKNQSLIYELQQQIVETENQLRFLTGSYNSPILRNSNHFLEQSLYPLQTGIPIQLLSRRPDIRQAELTLEAAKVDVQVAKASFYPSFRITGALGYNAFQPGLLFSTPESMLYGLAGDMLAPLVNRNALKAQLKASNAKQLQAVYEFEQKLLEAYLEVNSQVAMVSNLEQSFTQKSNQVAALTQSIDIANKLFSSARADYVEVLLTQREALESRMELVETKLSQVKAGVGLYQKLGGGWY